MKKNKILIIAANSDIGTHLVRHYLLQGCEVVGTYRTHNESMDVLSGLGARLFHLDIDSPEQVLVFVEALKKEGFVWDVLISAVGLLAPIGNFFSLNFDAWERSVVTNSTSQLRVLHAVHGIRGVTPKIILFAGGGTNGPFDNYSAYCLGKLSLIKMTELLDSECPDLQISIIGTGWVNTKIHRQTLDAGAAAGVNLERTREYVASEKSLGATVEDVAQCIDWCIAADRSAVSGRNFSLVHDAWRDTGFIDELKSHPNTYKLRRLS